MMCHAVGTSLGSPSRSGGKGEATNGVKTSPDQFLVLII